MIRRYATTKETQGPRPKTQGMRKHEKRSTEHVTIRHSSFVQTHKPSSIVHRPLSTILHGMLTPIRYGKALPMADRRPPATGVGAALLAAALFGASTPLTKLLVDIQPLVL